MRFLVIGDVVGKPGRKLVSHYLAELREELRIDATIVNGENAAGGLGITPEVSEELFACGVDVITTGNHVWDKKEIIEYLPTQRRLLRPLNYPPGVPGEGFVLISDPVAPWAVINASGRVFMGALDCPFQRIEQELTHLRRSTRIILVDFHAEATSEKMAMGWFLDGQVSCLFGTHTHVATADERIFPNGTAYITDIGMTGAHDSVIGVEVEIILNRFLTGMPVKNAVAKDNLRLNGIVVDIDPASGRANDIFRVSRG
ncbi:MAG TPA: TIGR00282 family metallophosphoesterase [Atribacteraceae bacterium]|nr:TIGR00282 family metallophosphoesterase [Atribacteraceae bacterium]